MKIHENAISNRYDFVILFDVENGNPNGDPDAGNMPRVDAETGHGIVTDVCIKRKIRNYVQLIKEEGEGYKIFIKEVLNPKMENAYKTLEIEKKTKDKSKIKEAQQFMCANFFDVRTFGAVMSTGDAPCGVVRGPVQLNFAKSIDPITPQEISITRQAVTTVKDAEGGKETEIGKKSFVPYALYKMEGFISAKLAEDVTGFNKDDLELLWEAIINMFEHDRSAARGKMILRKLIVFKHESPMGNAPSHKLLERISVFSKLTDAPARRFEDYSIEINRENLPVGVEFIEKI